MRLAFGIVLALSLVGSAGMSHQSISLEQPVKGPSGEFLFVPGSLFSDAPLGDWISDEQARAKFERLLDMQRSPGVYAHRFPGLEAPDCFTREEGGLLPVGGPQDYRAFLEDKEVVVVGRVGTGVAGWSPAWGVVAERIEVRIEEVLRLPEALVGFDALMILRPGGTLDYQGVRLCFTREQPLEQGRQVVVIGNVADHGSGVIHPAWIFETRDGQVVIDGYPTIKSEMVALPGFRSSLLESEGSEENGVAP